MFIFVSWETTIECVVIALFLSLALIIAAHKILGILQSCAYSGKKLLGWAVKKNNMTFERLALLAFVCALSSAVLSLCFFFAGRYASIIGLAAYVAFFIVYAYADSKVALRTPATRTPRFLRLTAVSWLVIAVVCYIAVTLLNFADRIWGNQMFSTLKYCCLAVLPLALIPLICLANLITKIYEVPHSRGFIKKAKAKLAASHVKVVGITGSYGKTSAKNILSSILSGKMRVLSTPRSHNTPLGISLSVNNNNLDDYDIFIAEMGARHVGDIAELCAICPPDYSIITGICSQHLESFKSIENIVRAKGEILAATKQKCVIAEDCYQLFESCGGQKIVCDCVSDVKADCTGTTFTLTLGGRSEKVSCKLLGEHSAYNIGLCAAVAFELGMTTEEIADAVQKLDYIEHRLQLIESNGVNIIDDGYNSNVKGAEAAINVLKSFKGRKIAVTPGLVELGVLEESENAALGAKLVGLDKVILVGDTLVGAVKEGYLKNGGDAERIETVPTLFAAQDKLKGYLAKGDTVLFLNDLPDVY